jgi:hypothetical protein
MKHFNMTSPKFDERGGTHMQSNEAAHGLRSVMAGGLDHSRLYKKKMMASTVTPKINLVYLWSPMQCTQCKQVLIWVSPTSCERGETNRAAQLQ